MHEIVRFKKKVNLKKVQRFDSEKAPKIYFVVLTTSTNINNNIFPLRLKFYVVKGRCLNYFWQSLKILIEKKKSNMV